MRRLTLIAAVIAAAVALTLPVSAPAQTSEPGPIGTISELLCQPLRDVADGLEAIPQAEELVRSVADVVCSLEALEFSFVTVYDPPGAGGEVRKTHQAILNIPTLMDVDGAGGPDLVGTLRVVNTSQASMTVERAAGAAEELPVSVEALVRDPRGEARGAAFGYDARASKAPQRFDATLSLDGSGRATTVGIDMRNEAPGDSLAVIGELFTPGPGAQRLDPQKARITYTPVPTASNITVRVGDPNKVDLRTNRATRVDLHAEDVRGDDSQIVDASIDQLPPTLSIELDQGDDGSNTIRYRAAEAVGAVDATLQQRDGSTVLQDASLKLRDLPTEIDVTQAAGGALNVAANGPIGVTEAAIAQGGEARTLDEPAYVRTFDDGTTSSTALRVLGLERATLSTADPLSLEAKLAAGPFRVLIEDGARRIDGRILDLPSTVALTLSPENGTVDYAGSDPIGELTVNASDPSGLLERATELQLLMRDIPTSLDLGFGEGGGTVSLDAGGGELGLIELQATSGPDRAVPDGVDGIVLEDVPAHYVLAARITGLRRVAVTQTPTPDLDIATAGGRVFTVDLVQPASDGSGNTEIDARIDKLPSSARVRLIDDAQGQRITYEASGATDEIQLAGRNFAGLSGRADKIDVLLRDVPQTLTLGLDDAGGKVTIDAGGQVLGLLQAQLTSGPDANVPADVDGLVFEDVASHYLLFARVTGLRKVEVTQTPTPDLLLDTTGGRVFTVGLRQPNGAGGEIVLNGRIDSLSPNMRIRLVEDGAGARRVEYSADEATDEIEIDAQGLQLGRAKRAHLLLRGVPRSLTVGLGDDSGAVNIDAGGAEVGLVEALLTSGPTEAVPAGRDGVVLKDLNDRYVLAARITGLRRVTAVQEPAPDLFVDATGNRVFTIDLNQQEGSKVVFTRATLNTLKRNTRIRLIPTSAGQRISYDAASTTGSLSFATNSGDRHSLTASIAPVPASLDLCQASNASCNGSSRSANAGSVNLSASSHAVVNLLDCKRPLSNCTASNATESIRVINLNVRKAAFDANVSSSGSSGHIFFDTDNFNLNGEIQVRQPGSVDRITARFPNGFRANNRDVDWSAFFFIDRDGSINCPGGTDLDVRVFGLTIDVSGLYLC